MNFKIAHLRTLEIAQRVEAYALHSKVLGSIPGTILSPSTARYASPNKLLGNPVKHYTTSN